MNSLHIFLECLLLSENELELCLGYSIEAIMEEADQRQLKLPVDDNYFFRFSKEMIVSVY